MFVDSDEAHVLAIVFAAAYSSARATTNAPTARDEAVTASKAFLDFVREVEDE